MPHPPWYEDTAVDLRRAGSRTVTKHFPGTHPATVEARGAALTFCGWLTSETPRPFVVPVSGGIELHWSNPTLMAEVIFDRSGALAGIQWRWEPSAPDWARGVLARALHRVR